MKATKVTSYKKVPIYKCKNKYFAEVDNENIVKDSIEEIQTEVDKLFTDTDTKDAELTQADFSEDSKEIKFNTDIELIGRFEDTNKFGSLDISKDKPCTISKTADNKLRVNYNGINFICTKSGSSGITYTKFMKYKDNLFTVISNEQNFSQAYKIADLPFTFLTRKQMGLYTIFDSDDCQIKIKTDKLDKNNSLIKVKNFAENKDQVKENLYYAKLGNKWLVDCDDYIGFENSDKPKVTLPIIKIMKICADMNGVKLDKVKFIKTSNFSEPNTWKSKFVSNLNAEIDKQGLGEKLTVTLDNSGNVILANVETEDEFVVTDATEPSEYNQFLMDNGLKLDENNIDNFSETINFGIVNAIEKLAVKGLNSIASKGQQKALMAVYLGYAMKRYDDALEAIQNAINVAPKGVLQGHLRRMLINGEMPKGLSKLSDCPNLKGLETYKQLLSKVSGKLNNDAAVQAYKNADQLQQQLNKIGEQAEEYAQNQDETDAAKSEDIDKLTEGKNAKELGQLAKEKVSEFKEYCKEKNIGLPDIKESGGLKPWAEKVMQENQELDSDKEAYKKIREILDIAQKHDVAKNGNTTATEDIRNDRIDEFIEKINGEISDRENKLTKLKEKFNNTKNKKEKAEIKERSTGIQKQLNELKDKLAKAEEMKKKRENNHSYLGFSEELNKITSQYTTEFFAEKVRDSEFGICYQDRFGSLWSADPDTNKDATLLWQSKDGKEVPATDNNDAIMDESEMDDVLGIESEGEGESEDSGDDFDFGDEDEGGDDDFDFGDEEEGEGDESLEDSDDLGFSEDEDDDFDFGDEETEEGDDFDFEDLDGESEEEMTSADENISKSIEVMHDMYNKLYELAKNK